MSELNQIMVRNAHNDFDALLMAEAMESVGSSVFSITYNGQRISLGETFLHSEFLVWAKVKDDRHIRLIEKAIDRALKRRA